MGRSKKRKQRNSSNNTPPKEKKQTKIPKYTMDSKSESEGASSQEQKSSTGSQLTESTMSSTGDSVQREMSLSASSQSEELDKDLSLSPNMSDAEHKNISIILSSMNKRLATLDGMRLDITDLKKDITDLIKSVEFNQKRQHEMETQLTTLTMDKNAMQNSINCLENQNSELQDRLVKLEDYSRRMNLIFSGITEIRNENCEQSVRAALSPLDGQNVLIEGCHRLGPYLPGKTRDIIVKFRHYTDVLITLDRRFKLPRGIFVNKHYSQETKRKVDIIRPLYKEAKNRDNGAKLVHDSLIYKKKKYTVSNVQTIDFDTSIIGEKSDGVTVAFSGRYSPLSNLYPCNFTIDGVQYRSSEHYYQHHKCVINGDNVTASKILNSTTPESAMSLGKNIQTNEEWALSVGKGLMEKGTQAKFEQNPDLMTHLKNTKKMVLVESTRSNVWGSGIYYMSEDALKPQTFTGRNQMGVILMSIRDK